MMVLGSRAAMGYVLGRGAGAAAGNGLLTGLVAYWKLDEASGNAIDAHSGGYDMTQVNDPGAGTGKIYTTARTFVAANAEYFYRTPDAGLQLGDIDFAMAAWAYQPAGQTGIVFSQWNETAPGYRTFRILAYSTGSLYLDCSANGSTATSIYRSWSASAWHLILAWYDAAADKLYLQIDNGTPAESAHTGGAYANGTAQYRIGAQNQGGGAIITGTIGPVAMWKNRTLSADDRAALWNGGAGLAYSSFS